MAELRRLNSLADELRYGRDIPLGLAKEAMSDDPLGEVRGFGAGMATSGAGMTSLVADLLRKTGVMDRDYRSPVTEKDYKVRPELEEIPGTQEWALRKSGYDPYASEVMLGSSLDPMVLSDAGNLAQIVWHGTPHRWRKPSSEHIGAGEGAQAYSRGLYWAQSKGTGKHYQDQLRPRPSVTYQGKDITEHDDEFFVLDSMYDKLSRSESPKLAIADLIDDNERRVSFSNKRLEEITEELHDLPRGPAPNDYLKWRLNHKTGNVRRVDDLLENYDPGTRWNEEWRPYADRDELEEQLQGWSDTRNDALNRIDYARELDPDAFDFVHGESHLYEMDLPDEVIDRMMRWDQPLEFQPPNVKAFLLRNPEILDDMRATKTDQWGRIHNPSGQRIYGRLKDAAVQRIVDEDLYPGMDIRKRFKMAENMVSEQLREAGIPGMRYDDWTRNRPGKSPQNYVTYNDDDIIPIARDNDILNEPHVVESMRADILRRMDEQALRDRAGLEGYTPRNTFEEELLDDILRETQI